MQPEALLYTAQGIVSAALLVSFFRVFRGPSLPDRVVAVDLMGVSSVGLMALGSAATGQHEFLDVALVIALIGFFGTVAYASYVVKEKRQ